jgi:hypothetical protein
VVKHSQTPSRSSARLLFAVFQICDSNYFFELRVLWETKYKLERVPMLLEQTPMEEEEPFQPTQLIYSRDRSQSPCPSPTRRNASQVVISLIKLNINDDDERLYGTNSPIIHISTLSMKVREDIRPLTRNLNALFRPSRISIP